MLMRELLGVIKSDAKVDIKIQNVEGVEKHFESYELAPNFKEYADREVRTVEVGEDNTLVVELVNEDN